jgi:hypothetical protein
MPNRYGFLLNFFSDIGYGEDKKTCSLRKPKVCQIGMAFIDFLFFILLLLLLLLEILDMAHGEDKKTYPLRKPNYAK